MEDLIRVATLLAPHGVRGEVKAAPEADDPHHLATLGEAFVGASADTARPVRIAKIRVSTSRHGHTLFVLVDGIASPEAAERLRGLGLFARRADLPLADDEYFLDDATGFDVVDEAGAPIGTIREILELPGGPTLVVARDGRPDALVPDVPAFVVALDLDAKRLVLRPIPGLLDLDLPGGDALNGDAPGDASDTPTAA